MLIKSDQRERFDILGEMKSNSQLHNWYHYLDKHIIVQIAVPHSKCVLPVKLAKIWVSAATFT